MLNSSTGLLMADIEALRAQCRTAREAGDFELAAKVGQDVWAMASGRDGWDGWSLGFSLRKINHPDKAMRVIWDAFKIIADDPAAVAAVGGRLSSEFGWSAYNAELKSPKNPVPTRIARVAKAVVQASDRYAPGVPWTTQFCPVPIVVNRAMKLLKEAQAWAPLADLAAITDGDRHAGCPHASRPGRVGTGGLDTS